MHQIMWSDCKQLTDEWLHDIVAVIFHQKQLVILFNIQ